MSSTHSVIRRAARSTQDRPDIASSKSGNNKPQTIKALTKSINSVEDRASRQRLAALQRQAIASGGAYTQVERDMIQRLVTAVKDGGNLELALAAEVIDVVGDLAKRNPKGELYENQREIAFLLLDAIGSNKHDQKQLEPIIDEFRKLSTDDDGFTEKDAQRIRDLLRNLDMLDEAADGGKRPGGSYKDIDDIADSQPGKLVPGERVPDTLDLGDFKLPKDGGKGRGGAGGKDDDETGKGAEGEAKPKPGDVAAAIGVLQGLAGGADKKDDQSKDGKEDARGTDDKGRDPKGKDTEGKDPEGSDTRGKDDKGRDTRGQDPDGTGGAKGKDDKGKGEDRRVEGPDGRPSDIKLPRNVIDGKFPEGTRVQDPEDANDPKDPKDPSVRSKPDDVDGGANEATAKDPTDPTDPTDPKPDDVEDPKTTAGADKDGRVATVSGSVSAAAVLLRTPFPPVMKQTTPLEMTAQNKVVALANPKGAGQLFFKFDMGADGNFDLYQSRNGKDGWVIVSKGWSGDAQVQYGTTYELTTGGVGTVGVSTGNQDDPLAGSGAAGYAQFKWIDTFRVQNRDWDKPDAKKRQRQFRVRLIAQVTVQGGFRTEEGQESPRVTTIGDLRVEYRWGRTSKVASPDGKGSQGIPDSFNQWEVGVGVGLGVALDFVALGKAAEAGDVAKLKDIAATIPRGAVTVQFWLTGLQKMKAWTLQAARALVNKKNNPFTRTSANILQKFGEFFQSYVVSAFAAVGVRGNNPNTVEGRGPGLTAITVANQIGTSSSAGSQGSDADAGLPSREQLEGMADGILDDVKGLFDWLQESGLTDLASKAAPIIETVAALAAVKKLASKKGLINFAMDQLSPEERGRMTDLVMSRAFELALDASGVAPDPTTGKGLDPSKGFMKLPGESIAEYGARIIKLVVAKIPQAAKDVLLDEASWEDILTGKSSSGGSGSSGGGGPIAGGDPTAGGKAAAIGAAIGAGLGLGGLIAGPGKDDDNKDDDDKDVDKPTVTGGPGGSRNAALNAVHEADEAQGDRLPITVEGKASIYITPKLAADPVYMAAYVARLAHDQDGVAAARKYAAAMSDLGYSKDAARVLAPLLTNAEIADPAFMKTLDAALAGIKRQPSDVGGVIYETQVKNLLASLRGKDSDPEDVADDDPLAGAAGGGSRGKSPTDAADPRDVTTGEPETALPTSARQKLAEVIVQTGSKDDLWVNVDEMRKGLEVMGYATGHLSDGQLGRLISAYNSDGNGAMSAPQIAQALQDGALLADGATVDIDLGAAFNHAGAALNIAQRVLRNGSDRDAWANRKELDKGFDAAGFDVKARDDEMNRVIATYGVSGTGALTAQELASAIEDGVIHLGADGSVTVNTQALQVVQGEGASNIASRVIGAADQASDAGDATQPYEYFLRVGFRDAGYTVSGVSGDDMGWLIDTYGDGGRIAQDGLARAIADGAVRIAADGMVTVHRNPTPPGRGGIGGAGLPGPGSIIIDGEPA